MIPARLLVPVVAVSGAVVAPSVALSVVVVVVLVVSVSVVSVIPNSCCATAQEGYCPSMVLDAITPVAAIENTAAARSNRFVNICCVGRDFIDQGKSNLDIMNYTRNFGIKYFIFILKNGCCANFSGRRLLC